MDNKKASPESILELLDMSMMARALCLSPLTDICPLGARCLTGYRRLPMANSFIKGENNYGFERNNRQYPGDR